MGLIGWIPMQAKRLIIIEAPLKVGPEPNC